MEAGMLKKVWALTGGIASGKSTVEKMFSNMGALVIDADQVGKDLLRPESSYLPEFYRFLEPKAGCSLKKEDGGLNRALLRELMMQNEPLRQDLENFLHPLIRKESLRRMAMHWNAQKNDFDMPVIYSAALIFEKNLAPQFKGVILVTADPAIQKQRLVTRDKINGELADGMMRLQQQNFEREQKAQYVISNNGSLHELQKQVENIYYLLTNKHAGIG